MDKVLIGQWQVDFSSGACARLNHTDSFVKGETHRLEPKTCQLLKYLAQHPGQLVTKEQVSAKVWPGAYASDETIARTISRLRTSLGDDPKNPQYIETVPKRGYMLVADVSSIAPPLPTSPANMQSQLRRRYWQIATSILLVSLLSYGLRVSLFNEEPPAKNLLSLADDYYHQIRLADNEMAISLYQQHITLHPDSGAAYAGLANSLVQKALRWSGTQDNKGLSLTGKVAAGALADEASQQQLLRARALAEKALALQPDSATTLKALGFVLSAQGDYNEAIAVYQQALQADPQAWQVQLNIGELYQATGNMPQAARI